MRWVFDTLFEQAGASFSDRVAMMTVELARAIEDALLRERPADETGLVAKVEPNVGHYDDDEFKEIDSWFVKGLEAHADLAGVSGRLVLVRLARPARPLPNRRDHAHWQHRHQHCR